MKLLSHSFIEKISFKIAVGLNFYRKPRNCYIGLLNARKLQTQQNFLNAYHLLQYPGYDSVENILRMEYLFLFMGIFCSLMQRASWQNICKFIERTDHFYRKTFIRVPFGIIF